MAEPGVSLGSLVRVVATLGPASDAPEVIGRLIEAGVAVFRLNFSHGTREEHALRLERVRAAARDAGLPVAVLGDLPGPKIRIGHVPDVDEGGGLRLEAGQDVLIDPAQGLAVPGATPVLGCTHEGLVDDVHEGERVLINDGAIRMLAVGSEPSPAGQGRALRCRVIVGGALTSGKGLNLPDSDLSVQALGPRDLAWVDWAVGAGVDFLAMSFVRTPEEVDELKARLDGLCARDRVTGEGSPGSIPVVAKIEKPQGVMNMEGIVRAADAIMVARGDLGVEMDLAQVPVVQKQLIAAADAWGKPCIVATQMLESMIQAPAPTRAEASDVANAVFDGADAVMLSGETAVGRYPVLAVETMQRIIHAAEERIAERAPEASPPRGIMATGYRTAALAHGAWHVARDIGARLVVCWSQEGGSARYLSQTGFRVPIIACSSSERQTRRMALLKGVRTLTMGVPDHDACESPLAAWNRRVDDELVTRGWAEPGDPVVLLAGMPLGVRGATNTLAVHYVGNPVTGFRAHTGSPRSRASEARP